MSGGEPQLLYALDFVQSDTVHRLRLRWVVRSSAALFLAVSGTVPSGFERPVAVHARRIGAPTDPQVCRP